MPGKRKSIVSVRLDPELIERIEEVAKATSRTRSNLIELMIRHTMMHEYPRQEKARKRRETKTFAPITMRINAVLLERFDAIAYELRRNRSELVDRALEEYVERQEQQHQPAEPAPRNRKH